MITPASPQDTCGAGGVADTGDPSDSGRSQFDNHTCDATPTIRFRLDDNIFLQDIQGHSASAAALRMLPWPVAFVIVSHFVGRLVKKVGPQPPIVVGGATFVASVVLLEAFDAGGEPSPHTPLGLREVDGDTTLARVKRHDDGRLLYDNLLPGLWTFTLEPGGRVEVDVRSVRSTHETSAVGTRNDMPVSLPFVSGRQSPTAFAAPVDAGMMFMYALRPPR